MSEIDAQTDREVLAAMELPMPNGWQFIRLGTVGADLILAAGFSRQSPDPEVKA